MFCHQCGKEISAGAQFCTFCGANITSPVPGASISPSVHAPTTTTPHTVREPASIGTRLANYFIDYIVIYILTVVVGVVLLFIFPFLAFIVFFFGLFIYYLVFESIWQRTPGKWVTGTKVVMWDGSKPDFPHVLGRSFARLIPLDWVSFLFNSHPIGWHDYVSGTMVVSKDYTADDVRQIDATKQKSSVGAIVAVVILGGLFMIAIVGLLAAIVLTSLSAARAKGHDAALMSELRSTALDLELYASAYGTYPDSLDKLASSTNAYSFDLNEIHYSRCTPKSYHMAVSLSEATAFDRAAAKSGPLCDGDPIDASKNGTCTPSDSGSYCYDVVQVSQDSATTTNANRSGVNFLQ